MERIKIAFDMINDPIEKKEKLLEACRDLRLPVTGNESIKTLELYIQTSYDEFESQGTNSCKTTLSLANTKLNEEDIEDYGSIGDKSWRLRYFINKILFFL
jgi:hypothetical protein